MSNQNQAESKPFSHIEIVPFNPAPLEGVLQFPTQEFLDKIPQTVKWFGLTIDKDRFWNLFSGVCFQNQDFVRQNVFQLPFEQFLKESQILLLESTDRLIFTNPRPLHKVFNVFVLVSEGKKLINSQFILDVNMAELSLESIPVNHVQRVA